jgi:hypothetical protein
MQKPCLSGWLPKIENIRGCVANNAWQSHPRLEKSRYNTRGGGFRGSLWDFSRPQNQLAANRIGMA